MAKRGDRVRLVQPVIEGKVVQTVWDEARDCKKHEVEYAGSDGLPHKRWFLETELEEVKEND